VGRDGPIHGLFHRFVFVGISKDFVPVDDDGEPLPDSMSDAKPHAPWGVEAHDLNSNPRTEILQELLRQTMRALRVLSDEGRRFASFFCLQRLDALIRERLGARRAAGFQDRREQAEQLDSGRPGGHGPEYRRSKVKAFRTGGGLPLERHGMAEAPGRLSAFVEP